MRRILSLSLVLSVLVLGLGVATAQSPKNHPLPKVIWLYHETVKPAKDSTHEKVEHAFAQVWAKAEVQPFLGMNSLSSTDEAVFISGYDSFSGFEKDFQVFNNAANGPLQTELAGLERQEADLVSGVRSTVAVLQDELCYQADKFMAGMPQSRYFEIVTMRVNPGNTDKFAEVAKFYRDAFSKGEFDQPFAVYRVMFGAPSATYLVLLPMKSLKSVDEALVTEPKVLAAMGEDEMKSMMKTAGEILTYDQSDVYVFNPKMSHVPADFAASDPAFWTPMPQTVTKPAPGHKPMTNPKR